MTVYNEVSQGGAKLNSTAIISVKASKIGSGGIVLAGLSTTSITIIGISGAKVAGRATTTFYDFEVVKGGVVAAGIAAKFYNNYGTGGGLANGSAIMGFFLPGHGGAVVAGDSIIESQIVARKGALVGGYAIGAFYDLITSSVGVIVGGRASLNFNDIVENIAGGLLAAGTANTLRTYLEQATSGGIIAAGSADYVRFYYPRSTGGIVSNGTSLAEMPVYHYPNTTDGIQAVYIGSGDGVSTFAQHYDGSGEIVIASDFTGKAIYRYQPDGTNDTTPPDFAAISIGYLNYLNPTIVSITLNIDLDIGWRIDSYISVDYRILWNTGKQRQYWYRIIGSHHDDVCPPIQMGDDCCKQYVMNIHASSIEDLCLKLQKKKWKWPIQLVQRFTKPAETVAIAEDEAAGVNYDCNTIEEVEICPYRVCADFCVDYDLVDTWGIVSSADKVRVYTYHPSLTNIYIGGDFRAKHFGVGVDFIVDPSGGIAISGGDTYSTNYYQYSGSGGITVDAAIDVVSTNWGFIGGSYPSMSANAAPRNFAQFQVLDNDASWQLPEKVIVSDNTYAVADLSYAVFSKYLVCKDFNLLIPDNVNILGIQVQIERHSNTLLRDEQVYLIHGNNQIISDNLAKTGTWPVTIDSVATYGSVYNEWRNANSPDYLGPWQPSDFTSDFGVAIRIRPLNNVVGGYAYIDQVTLRVFYEDQNHQKIVVSGNAKVQFTNYKFQSTGSITIGSGDNIVNKVRWKVDENGLGLIGPEYAALRIIGGYAPTFHYQSQDTEISIGGNARRSSSYWRYSGTDGITLDGEARIKSCDWHWVASGGVTLDSVTKSMPVYATILDDVNITISGSSDFRVNFATDSSGSVTIGGLAITKSTNHRFVSDGNAIFILGDTGYNFGHFGTFEIGMGVITKVHNLKYNYGIESTIGTITPPTTLVNGCLCKDMSLELSFSHNLIVHNKLSQFLSRNNIPVSKIVKMFYNTTNNVWQKNFHYRGKAAGSTTNESWSVIFELGCVDNIGGEQIDQKIWKFTLSIIQKNLDTLEDFDSKLILAFVPDNVCATGSFRSQISVDTQNNLMAINPSSTIYHSVLYDNIGLFTNPYWIDNPNLVIYISQLPFADSPIRVTPNIGI
jgi:hypothetical protein